MLKRWMISALVTSLLVFTPVPSAAQGGGDGYLFRAPRIQLGLRLGFAGAQAGSDLFDFTTEELTVDRGDFGGGLVGADLAFRTSERFDLVLSFASASSTTRSEFRDWVGEDDLPIEQQTTFTRRPFTVSGRYYFKDRGRSVSRFAWIPNSVTPFVVAGTGVMWYEFSQDGDFVDFDDLGIFNTRFQSDGWGIMGLGGAGVEVSISPRAVVQLEGRYEFASGELSQDFVGFDDIDLSGFQVSVGLGLRF